MDKLVIVILNLAALSALFYLFDYPYRRYRERALRDRIFVVRDKLFSIAESGVISFTDPAYTTTRRMLNGMIRYAHNLSLWRLIVMTATRQKWKTDESDAYFAKYKLSVEQLSKPARGAITEAMMEAHIALISHLLHTSLATFPGAVLTKYTMRVFISLRAKYQGLIDSKFLQPANSVLDREALIAGDEFPAGC